MQTRPQAAGGSYAEDTEIMTPDGWRPYWEVDETTPILQYDPESGELTFVPAGPCHLYYYTGSMIHFLSDHVDIMVTPDHGIYALLLPDGECYGSRRAAVMPTYAWRLLSPPSEGESSFGQPTALPRNIHDVCYQGQVFDYNVPSGLFVTRRNGKATIQGNAAKGAL